MKRILAAAALLLGASFGAQAQNYTFECVTYNRGIDCAVGEAQLGFNLVDRGGSVDFVLSNTGPEQGAITDIYFDWMNGFTPLTPGTITGSEGVAFSWGVYPEDLPGGSRISFVADIGADSSPAHPWGVDSGEWVAFNFAGGYDNMLAGLNTGDLRVGVQFKGLATGGAESFVVTPVPEPETYAMLLAGLFMMGFVVRRRRSALTA